MDRARIDLVSELKQFPLGRSVTHDESGAARPQRSVEVGEALEQELRTRPRGVATVQKAVVEAEHRHYSVVVVQGRPKRGVVVQAQVAAKPDQGGVDAASKPVNRAVVTTLGGGGSTLGRPFLDALEAPRASARGRRDAPGHAGFAYELQVAQACLAKAGLRDREVHLPEAAKALVVAELGELLRCRQKALTPMAQGEHVARADVLEPDGPHVRSGA